VRHVSTGPAIREAQHSIKMECYIFRPDETGRAFMITMMIDIIAPGPHADQRWVRLVSRRKYNKLLARAFASTSIAPE
jgi:hypothetical protein